MTDQRKCWVCENFCYTLLFWTESKGWGEEHFFDGLQEENLAQQLEDIHPALKKRNALKFPHIFSSYSNWKPFKLKTVQEVCFDLDKNKPDFLEDLKSRN